jgi:hypothetical protein
MSEESISSKSLGSGEGRCGDGDGCEWMTAEGGWGGVDWPAVSFDLMETAVVASWRNLDRLEKELEGRGSGPLVEGRAM